MKKCPLCKGTGKIKVDDYNRLRTRIADCPVCKPVTIDNKAQDSILRKEV